MYKRPILYIILFLLGFSLLLTLVIIGELNSKKKISQVMEENIATGQYYEDLNKNIREVQSKTENQTLKEKGMDNLHQYNKLNYYIDSYFELLSTDKYENAYILTNSDYLKYMGIEDVEAYKQYVTSQELTNTSCEIQKVIKGKGGNNQEVCMVAMLPRQGGEEYSSTQNFKEYLATNTYKTDVIIVDYLDKGKYTISFDGFIKRGEKSKQEYNSQNIGISIIAEDTLVDAKVYEVEIKNISSSNINIGEEITGIIAKTPGGDTYYADKLSNSKENELIAKQSKPYKFTFKCGNANLNNISISQRNGETISINLTSSQ